MYTYLLMLCMLFTSPTGLESGIEAAQNQQYEKALLHLNPLKSSELEDPQQLLFFRGISNFSLQNYDEALTDINALLQLDCERRYFVVARRVKGEIEILKPDTLNEISHLMKDSTRRLDVEKLDKSTSDLQQTIIDKLDKLIEKAEQQQQQQQAAAAQSGGQQQQGKNNSSSPAEESRINDDKGKGDAGKRNLQMEDGWGNLPPAERQKSLQKIGEELPTHYREAIEAYFRKMATDK